jgi:TorA maturation chaperone TorD
VSDAASALDDVTLRRDLARLLAALLLAPPAPAALRALAHPDTRAVLAAVLGDAADAPTRALASAGDEAAARAEFFALLAVPGARYQPPFESVYRDEREVDGARVGGLLLGDSAARVAAAYARAGFALDAPELPDHLGCELAFLAELLARAVELLRDGDVAGAARACRDAADFAREHPARWVDALRARLAADPAAEFYPAVVALAAALVRDLAARGRLPVVT